MTFAQKPTLTKEERDLIRKTQEQLEKGLRISGDILSEEEIALVMRRSFDNDRIRLITNFL